MESEPSVSSLQAAAIAWHVRLRDGDEATWAAFADWLAEDPHHAQAYDLVEQIDLEIEPLLPALRFEVAANDEETPEVGRDQGRRHRWGLYGGALAAGLAALAIASPWMLSSRYDVVTRPGEQRVVTLDAGTQATLNGATHVIFDHKDPRFASLVAGEALFQVRHDAGRPFILGVGGRRIQDIGTLFDVVRDTAQVRIAVAEGEVLYDPSHEAIKLSAGEALTAPLSQGPASITSTSAGEVGGWREGRLAYVGEPLSRVAADLSRALGVRILVAPSLAGRPFSGALIFDRSHPEELRRLAPALNVALGATPDGWIMKPLDGDGR